MHYIGPYEELSRHERIDLILQQKPALNARIEQISAGSGLTKYEVFDKLVTMLADSFEEPSPEGEARRRNLMQEAYPCGVDPTILKGGDC